MRTVRLDRQRVLFAFLLFCALISVEIEPALAVHVSSGSSSSSEMSAMSPRRVLPKSSEDFGMTPLSAVPSIASSASRNSIASLTASVRQYFSSMMKRQRGGDRVYESEPPSPSERAMRNILRKNKRAVSESHTPLKGEGLTAVKAPDFLDWPLYRSRAGSLPITMAKLPVPTAPTFPFPDYAGSNLEPLARRPSQQSADAPVGVLFSPRATIPRSRSEPVLPKKAQSEPGDPDYVEPLLPIAPPSFLKSPSVNHFERSKPIPRHPTSGTVSPLVFPPIQEEQEEGGVLHPMHSVSSMRERMTSLEIPSTPSPYRRMAPFPPYDELSTASRDRRSTDATSHDELIMPSRHGRSDPFSPYDEDDWADKIELRTEYETVSSIMRAFRPEGSFQTLYLDMASSAEIREETASMRQWLMDNLVVK